MARGMGFIGFLIVVVALLQGANAATTYIVGDSLGWAVPPNNSVAYYDQWASNKTFEIDDSFVFNWNGSHTATEVASEEDYNNCTKTGIMQIDNGVPVSFTANGTHYFICSVGTHCEQGQKVIIKVGNGIPPDDSAAPSLTVRALFAVLSTVVVFFLSYV